MTIHAPKTFTRTHPEAWWSAASRPVAAVGPRIGLLELDRVDDLLDLLCGLGAGALVGLAIDPDDLPVDIDDPDPDRRAEPGGIPRIALGGYRGEPYQR